MSSTGVDITIYLGKDCLLSQVTRNLVRKAEIPATLVFIDEDTTKAGIADIKATPTIVFTVDCKEVKRLIGASSKLPKRIKEIIDLWRKK